MQCNSLTKIGSDCMNTADTKIRKTTNTEIIYRKVITSVMEMIVDRYQRNDGYRWVDTKKSLLTGFDYQDEDFLKGKNTIYCWIQGRALEALTYHSKWLENNGREDLADELKIILSDVLESLEKARETNGGHLFFFMDKDGKAFNIKNGSEIEYLPKGSISTYNLSDLFGSKGMYKAARYLGKGKSTAEAKRYSLDVMDSIWQGNFKSDQFSFRGDIRSAGAILNSIGPYMLMLDAVNMWIEDCPDEAAKTALRLVDRVMSNHICIGGKWNFGEEYDCIEMVETDGWPVIRDGVAESDPGHSIEFVGLALRVFYNLRGSNVWNKYQKIIEQYESMLVNILKRNFANGFVENVGGICKGFDLVSRKIIDSDMPWWSMPETMRASLYAAAICKDNDLKDELVEIYRKCHNGFVDNYLRPELSYMCVQTIGADGLVKDAIPATPDADPGYHTGVCLIDCISLIRDTQLNIEI